MGNQQNDGSRSGNSESIRLTPKEDTGGFSDLQNLKVGGLVQGLITLALIAAALIFFFMLVIGGIRWIISGGDKGQTEAARSQITAALIGLVIVFSAWAIANIIGTFFGVEIFGELKIPELL